jgi:hypothetical protein
LSSAAASGDAAVIWAKSFLSPSAGTFSSSRLISPASRRSSSLATSASSACPSRTCGAPRSIDATVHASVSILTSVGEIAGVRALPLFSRSSPRARSSASRDRFTP